METVLVILAVWFILIGIYGALPLLRTPRLKNAGAPRFVQTPLTAHIERELVPPRPATSDPKPARAAVRQPMPESAVMDEPPLFRTTASDLLPPLPADLESLPERPVRQSRPRTNPLVMFQADPSAGDPYAEVSMLRAQVEHLRSELVALSSSEREEQQASGREDRATRARRYKVGPYAELPRPLRRQVREVRNERRPIRA